MTNYERIKSMSIEEMAVMIANEIPYEDCDGCGRCYFKLDEPYRLNTGCQDAWLDWLESEV